MSKLSVEYGKYAPLVWWWQGVTGGIVPRVSSPQFPGWVKEAEKLRDLHDEAATSLVADLEFDRGRWR